MSEFSGQGRNLNRPEGKVRIRGGKRDSMVANRGMGWTQVWKRGEKVSQTWKKRRKEMFLFRVARGPRGRYQKLVEDEVIKKQKRK
jgi:hypothetical protein